MAHFYVKFSITSLANLQTANNALMNCIMEALTNVLDAAAKAALAIAQAIMMNMLTSSHLSRGASADKLEIFDGKRDKAEHFILSVCIAVVHRCELLGGCCKLASLY